MEEIARVYADALFGVAKEKGKLDAIREQLGQFADALAENRQLQLFFFSPNFSSAETAKAQAADEGREKKEELLAAARRDIEAETRRSLERIRKEVADLTVLTTEKVTRKSLTGDDQKRLIDEALAEVDFSSLSGNGGAVEEAPA